MSAPIRFLSVAVLAWGALRATTLGAIPGFTVSHASELPPPPIVPTELSEPVPAGMEPVPGDWGMQSHAQIAAPPPPLRPTRGIPYYLPAYASAPIRPTYEPIVPRRPWSLQSARLVSAPAFVAAAGETPLYAELPPLMSNGVPVPQISLPATPAKLDRWQMSSWALLRGPPQAGALAGGGTLGGSQAGARISYAFNRSLAASLRLTSPIGGSSGTQLAAGVRWAPLRSLPVAITAERRQSIGARGGAGRSDFALFAEGGLYRRPLPWRFELDAYAQAGIVGLTRRDLFADGAMAVTRPIYGRFSAGFGVWGGYQPGLYRLDAGPRVSIKVRDNIRAHIDWRQRITGNSQPVSGPALTLAADF